MRQLLLFLFVNHTFWSFHLYRSTWKIVYKEGIYIYYIYFTIYTMDYFYSILNISITYIMFDIFC